MGVMGGVVFCALVLLLVYWCRNRRKLNRYHRAEGSVDSLESPTWGQRFGLAFSRRPHQRLDSGSDSAHRLTIGSFGNSRERITTPTPYYGQRSTEHLAPKSTPLAVPRVQFAVSFADSDDAEGRVRSRNMQGMVSRDRPPTYHTNSTGIATIATTLPQYSAVDPSPISERAELPDTPTTVPIPQSPLYRREKTRGSAGRPSQPPLTPIGEKF
ncbi:hypothetical protein AN958_11965 [Leucoagaricus sp. SymC.cos]|nr:hypothetical protein AN958_11965 [Leucoagaricus sp. SymC.cos]